MTSWLDILEELYRDSWNPELGRYRAPFAFRGMNRFGNSLASSLVRLADGRADVGRLELALLRNFRKYAHKEAPLTIRSGTGSPSASIAGFQRGCSTGRTRRSSRCTSRPRAPPTSARTASSGA